MDETRYTKPLNSMDKTTNTTDSMNDTINSVNLHIPTPRILWMRLRNTSIPNNKDSMNETTKNQGFYE